MISLNILNLELNIGLLKNLAARYDLIHRISIFEMESKGAYPEALEELLIEIDSIQQSLNLLVRNSAEFIEKSKESFENTDSIILRYIIDHLNPWIIPVRPPIRPPIINPPPVVPPVRPPIINPTPVVPPVKPPIIDPTPIRPPIRPPVNPPRGPEVITVIPPNWSIINPWIPIKPINLYHIPPLLDGRPVVM